MRLTQKLDGFEEEVLNNVVRENMQHCAVPISVQHTVDRVTNDYAYQSLNLAQENSRKILKQLSSKEEGFYIRGGCLYEGDVRICNFSMVLEKSYLRYEFEDKEAQAFDIRVSVNRKQNKKEFFFGGVSLTGLLDAKFISKIPFRVIYVDDFKVRWRRYVNYLVEGYEGDEEKLFLTAGWKQFGNSWYYVDGKNVIGNDKIKAHAMTERTIENSNIGQSWYEVFEKMREVMPQAKDKMTVLLLYVFGSFIYKLFDTVGKTLKFSLVLVGPRGSRKTSLALCFSQIEKKRSPTLNFQATVAGIQCKLKEYKDSVMLLDDLAPTHSNQRRHGYEEKLETILRLFGDATERVICTAFMNNTMSKPDYSVGGGCIITGEYFYEAAVESSIARTVVLEIESDMVDLRALNFYQKNPQVLEAFLHNFLAFVGKNAEVVFEKILTITEGYREAKQREYSNGRLAEYHGQLVAVGAILADFLSTQIGIDKKRFVCGIEECIAGVLRENDKMMRQKAPIYRLLRAIEFLINTDYHYRWGQDIKFDLLFIIEDETHYYIESSQLPAIIDNYCRKNAVKMISLSSQEATKLLANEGIISSFREGERIRYAKKYSEYKGKRLLQLSKAAMKKFIDF